MNNLFKTDELYECCPECEKDTVIRDEFTPQVCEHCKSVILPCSLCDYTTCKDCPLEKMR